jgi:hypothetical protein
MSEFVVIIVLRISMLVVLTMVSSMADAEESELEYIQRYSFNQETFKSPYRHMSIHLCERDPLRSSVTFWDGATVEHLREVLERVPSIFNVGFQETASLDLLDPTILSRFPNLEELEVHPDCDEKALRAIGRIGRLGKLWLDEVNVTNFLAIQHLKGLKSFGFDLRERQQISLEGVPWAELKNVGIGGEESSVIDLTHPIGRGVLESITIKGNIAGTFAVFKDCPLETLRIYKGHHTREQIASFASLSHLETFEHAVDTYAIEDSMLPALLNGWPYLRVFHVRCDDLSVETLREIVKRKGITDLGFRGPITPEHIPLLQKATHLKSLDIFRSKQLEKADRKALEDSLPVTRVTFYD